MNRIHFLTSGLVCIFSMAGAHAQTKPAAEDGNALLTKVCTGCHELDGVLAQRNSRERWSHIVDDMVSRGAEGTDAELNQVIDYLAKIRGPKVNVNQATAEQLTTTAGLPKATAGAIVDYREKHGVFKNAEELKKIPGVDADAIEQVRDRLDFAQQK
jgi:competence protein ComEA